MIYVTHDQIEAMTLADRIVVLRAGRVEQADTPLALFNRPANRFVAGFIGAPAMNFLPQPDGTTTGIRPQHLRLAAPATPAPSPPQVTLVEALGTETVAARRHPGRPAPPRRPPRPGRRSQRGAPVHLASDPADLPPLRRRRPPGAEPNQWQPSQRLAPGTPVTARRIAGVSWCPTPGSRCTRSAASAPAAA